ncbi:unnamed protein product, partial [Ilex paraguariensis]
FKLDQLSEAVHATRRIPLTQLHRQFCYRGTLHHAEGRQSLCVDLTLLDFPLMQAKVVS